MRSVIANELLKGLLNDPKLLNQRLCKMSQPRLLIEKKVTHRLLILFLSFTQTGMHNSCATFWSRLDNDWKAMRTLWNCKTQLRDLFLIALCVCAFVVCAAHLQ